MMWMSSGSTKSVIHQDGQDNQSNQNARVADIFHATGPSEYESVCVCVGEFDLTSFIQFILYLNSIDFSCVHESSWFEFLETFWPHEMHTGQHPLPVCWAEGLAIRYRSP